MSPKDVATSYESIGAIYKVIQPYLTGGLFVFALSKFFEWRKDRVQKIRLVTKKQGTISMLPCERGNKHYKNCHWIEFELTNTTSRHLDLLILRISFVDGEVIKCETRSKYGTDKLEISGIETKEISITLKHFNQKESIYMRLEIANLASGEYHAFIDGASGIALGHKSPKAIRETSRFRNKISPDPWSDVSAGPSIKKNF